jgi:MFS family permease
MIEKRSLMGGLFRKDFLVVFMIIVNAFSWYFPIHFFFTDTLSSVQISHTLSLAAYSIYFIAVIISAVIGGIIVHRNLAQETLLSVWMLVGVITSFLLAPLEAFENHISYIFLAAFALGVSLGLGFPTCLAYFADYGPVEQKGRLGGITYCVASLGIFLMGLVTIVLPSFQSMLIFAFWRIIGLTIFIAIKPEKNLTKKEKEISYRDIIQERSFVLYLFPWILFCLVNFLEGAVLKSFFSTDFYNLIPLMEFGVGGLAALVAGILADFVGRKRVIIFGYLLLGIGYAVLGLFSNQVLSWYFYITVDGIAWGVFALVFFITIWGELGGSSSKDKYYFLGILPFLVATYIEFLFEPYAGSISISASFSLASFFLFLAVLPLSMLLKLCPRKI